MGGSNSGVLLFCTSIRNPFVEAWWLAIRNTGAAVAVLVDAAENEVADVPSFLQPYVVYTRTADGVVNPDWKAQCELVVGEPPATIYYWWGLDAIRNSLPQRAWPNRRLVLCVDTFPNASRFSTELREILKNSFASRRLDGLVVTSTAMARAVKRRLPHLRAKDIAVVPSPFTLQTHASRKLERVSSNGLRLCLTGRNDLLFSSSKKMAKDDLGPWLSSLQDHGMQVFVQDTTDEAHKSMLTERGFSFYPSMPRSSITDGSFADMMSAFDGHLVYYNVNNPTIARRVSASLSTRFATGIGASTPLIVPPEANFAQDFFERHPIGFSERDPALIAQTLHEQGTAMKEHWASHHHEWAGEAFVKDLSSALAVGVS